MNIIPNLPILYTKKAIGKFVFTQIYLQPQLKFSKYSYYFNLKVDKILIMNHKIPYKFPRFINVFLGKVIEILIFHILMDLEIKPEFKWFVAKILVCIIIKIIKFINQINITKLKLIK
ncbi:hypothetical protein IM33_20220 [Clostridioides difficile]|nr:hypothetical protein IM33_20220 [Clostridioides difficile]